MDDDKKDGEASGKKTEVINVAPNGTTWSGDYSSKRNEIDELLEEGDKTINSLKKLPDKDAVQKKAIGDWETHDNVLDHSQQSKQVKKK